MNGSFAGESQFLYDPTSGKPAPLQQLEKAGPLMDKLVFSEQIRQLLQIDHFFDKLHCLAGMETSLYRFADLCKGRQPTIQWLRRFASNVSEHYVNLAARTVATCDSPLVPSLTRRVHPDF
ncbi:hypothetical protein HBI80_073130 [Parastagonospora nodorum]|nr:hypothetical protein HBI13_212090 [Parastagonospora nodorum]KAH4121302.1 hypothetical protein HBH47_103060 [Parastagonospora nodorum]KAH4178727.1 hypothetical protein HBH43_027930 [Parastagonospora nodorum]KAH4207041.1 hypothetical protein HBI95_111580 [Parastagonospora nodorum]KAH4239994.1 hypothetical protein HBI06_029220 [Parastagonospora nodorum]